MDVIRAPWSHDQVASLNGYQSSSLLHPFTCANRGDRNLDHRVLLGLDTGALIATNLGWVCADCDYVQDWAHPFMVDWGWQQPTPFMVASIFSAGKVPTMPERS